jgi:hypothetical protein
MHLNCSENSLAATSTTSNCTACPPPPPWAPEPPVVVVGGGNVRADPPPQLAVAPKKLPRSGSELQRRYRANSVLLVVPAPRTKSVSLCVLYYQIVW